MIKPWQKIKIYKDNRIIKKYKFCGFTLLREEKSPTKKKWNFLGVNVSKKNADKNHDTILNEYGKWLKDLKTNKSFFIPITQIPYKRKTNDVKIFAYYLPQFHCIPENDEAHGKGFTEWNNVGASVPAFVGHYQPQIPYDLGFYNLLMPGIMERQTELAKMYGVYGFCFYYYWFNGTKVLDGPLKYFLKSDIDFHFHFFWANETWSSRWQGGNKEIILEQKYDEDKFEQFFYDILPYFKDDRYEKIDNKPILMIYYPEDMGHDLFVVFSKTLNQLAQKYGFNGVYLTAVFDFKKNKKFLDDYKIDGLTEFFPAHLQPKLNTIPVSTISDSMKLKIYNLHQFIKKKGYIFDTDFDLYKCACPQWDNSPRKLFSEAELYQLEDNDFENWLYENIKWTKQHNGLSKQYTYVNAWNEWAEGAILEPTTRYGYKYLQIIKDVMESFEDD